MKKAIIFLCCLMVILSAVPATVAKAAYNDELKKIKPYADVILLVSLDDGSTIFNKNADMKTPPASLTKIVTATLVLQKCKNLNTVITVPEYTIRLLDNTNSSNVGLKPGEKISVYNLLHCLLIPSANEAATILADYISGSMDGFVDLMNTYVKGLGCKNTNFKNPHGLDADGQFTTANDMSKIVKAALKIPLFVQMTSTIKYTVPKTNLSGERVLRSTVYLMNRGIPEYYCSYATGIKTGSTEAAGRCVISKATKGGYSYLAVVMKAPFEDYDKDGVNENFAFIDCKKLFEWAFANIKLRVVAKPAQIISEVPVKLSWKVDHMQLIPQKEIMALVPSNIDEGSVLIEVVKSSMPKSVDAPIKKGQVIGEARVLYAEEEIARIKLVANEDVSRNAILYAGSLIKAASSTFAFKLIAGILVFCVAAYIGLANYVNMRRRKRKRLKVLNYRDVQGK
ncbi:MAG: D-alanyl-D-alanine carboxypeptidase family protein [Eubacteriales bacterium]